MCVRACVCFSFRLCLDLDWHCRLLELSNEMRALLVSDPEIHEEPAAGERAAGGAFYVPTKYSRTHVAPDARIQSCPMLVLPYRAPVLRCELPPAAPRPHHYV